MSRSSEKLVLVSASVLLHVEAIGSRVQPPVHAPDVVPGDVPPVLGKVDRRAEVRRAVQAVDEPIHHRSRQEFEAADPRQNLRIDKLRPGHRRGVGGMLLHYMPDFGIATAESRSSTIESVVIPSDSARKLVSTRCRSTGCAMARMSSKLT